MKQRRLFVEVRQMRDLFDRPCESSDILLRYPCVGWFISFSSPPQREADDPFNPLTFNSKLECELPNNKIYQFNGTL